MIALFLSNFAREWLIFKSEWLRNIIFLKATGFLCGILASIGLMLAPWTPLERTHALPLTIILGQTIYNLFIAQRAFLPDLEDRAIARCCGSDKESACYFASKLFFTFTCEATSCISFAVSLLIFANLPFQSLFTIIPVIFIANLGLLPTSMLLGLFAHTSSLSSVLFLINLLLTLPIVLIEGSIVYSTVFPPYHLDNLLILTLGGAFISMINILIFPKISRIFVA